MSLSLLGMFDDYTRKMQLLIQNDCTKEFLTFVRNQNQCRLQWKEAVEECQRLKSELDKSVTQISDLEKKLTRARMILHEEKERANAAEAEKNELHEQVDQVQAILGSICRAGDQLANETKEKLDRFLNNTHCKLRHSTGEGLYPRLDPINEIDSTGDLLSDVSMSPSNEIDDPLSLDSSDRMTSRSKKPRRSDVGLDEVPSKRRRSTRLSNPVTATARDHLVATTTVTMTPGGPVTAQSRIEARTKGAPRAAPATPTVPFHAPSAPPLPSTSSSDSDAPTPRINHFTRVHDFSIRTVLKPAEECCACGRSMGFASKIVRCGDCKASAHVECREAVPVPCIPSVATPRGERTLRLVDLVGQVPPLVPALVVRCVLEVERRGLMELGLYRVPGAEKDVRALRTRFQRGKGAFSLATYDIHVICGVLKDFLRSLPEPVVTHTQWPAFTNAVREAGHERSVALYQQVAELPPAHRDTLAFIVLHLLRVAQSPPCKMTISNLATVFGPTLVGYSSANPTNTEMCNQTPLQAMVVESLLDLGEDYWRNVITKAPATPMLTPKYSFRTRNGKNSKIFSTPPAK